jgi:hypothetical protein
MLAIDMKLGDRDMCTRKIGSQKGVYPTVVVSLCPATW